LVCTTAARLKISLMHQKRAAKAVLFYFVQLCAHIYNFSGF
jgi:hypothetical protein